MYTYKITALFIPEWPSLFDSIFGVDADCQASLVEGNIGTFTFTSPQSPANLGPLVKVEVIPTPASHLPL
jgi:hypothetical protein